MGNCCFKLPFIPTNGNNGGGLFLDALQQQQRGGDNDDNNNNNNNNNKNNKDWLILDHDTGDGLLTMILTLESTSDLSKTQEFIQKNSNQLKNVLFSKPRRSSSAAAQQQPTWTSPKMNQLFQSIGQLPNLEVLLLHEVGTSSNPIPITGLQQIFPPTKIHPHLKQTYLVGHFVGDDTVCNQFAASLQQQPQLQSFALYGNGSREFTLDPILQAVSQLPTLKYLYFHGNMPNPLSCQTIEKVGNMSHLETLTIHSCDTNGTNLCSLAQYLETSKCLKELTVFEAFELFQGRNEDDSDEEEEDHDDDGNNDDEDSDENTTTTTTTNTNSGKPRRRRKKNRRQSCAAALKDLILYSPSLEKVQIWFGFCTDSTVLQQFATALATKNEQQQQQQNHPNPQQQDTHATGSSSSSKITSFETALLWTEYDDDTAKSYVDMIRNNVHLTKLQLGGYKGCWRLPIWFFVRLNQTGRKDFLPDRMTTLEWIDVLTDIPPLIGGGAGNDTCGSSAAAAAAAALEDAPSNDPDWFETSWRYYYLRMYPSFVLPTATATATTGTA